MTRRRLMTDVNLSSLDFLGSAGGVTLEFVNMSDGGRVGLVSCKGLVVFTCHDYADSILPVYVGEVVEDVVSGSEAVVLLQEFGYQVGQLSESATLHHVSVEGGLMIRIVCRELDVA